MTLTLFAKDMNDLEAARRFTQLRRLFAARGFVVLYILHQLEA